MQIVIVGGGTVGIELAVHLQQAGNDISLVERDPARCADIREKQDILVVEGPGSSPLTLEQAGIAEAEMVLAVTSIDEALAKAESYTNKNAKITALRKARRLIIS